MNFAVKLLAGLLSLFVAAAIISISMGWVNFGPFIPITDSEVETAIRNCDQLVPSAQLTEIDRSKVGHTTGYVYTIQYRSSVSPASIAEVYRNQIMANGWEFEKRTNSANISYKFYKDKYFIDVIYPKVEFLDSTSFSVSCGWSNSRYGLIGDLFYR